MQKESVGQGSGGIITMKVVFLIRLFKTKWKKISLAMLKPLQNSPNLRGKLMSMNPPLNDAMMV